MANYKVGQKRWAGGEDTTNIFLTPVTNKGGQVCQFKASRISTYIDDGTTVSSDEGIGFYDECLLMTQGDTFRANVTYYFHGCIMRLPTDQVFNILLRPLGVEDVDDVTASQYVKKIVIGKNTSDSLNSWADVHFTFTPVIDSFNALTFQLTRSSAAGDLNAKTIRVPAIIYEEISMVSNYISEASEFVKIGIQTHPGLEMCVNGEEITVGRSGIYEVKSNLITVDKFSVLNAAVEEDDESGSVDEDSEYYFKEFAYVTCEDAPLTAEEQAAYELKLETYPTALPDEHDPNDDFYGHRFTYDRGNNVMTTETTDTFDDLYGHCDRLKSLTTQEILDIAQTEQYLNSDVNGDIDRYLELALLKSKDLYPVCLTEDQYPKTILDKVKYKMANNYWHLDFYYALRKAYIEEIDMLNEKYAMDGHYINHLDEMESATRRQIIKQVASSRAYILESDPEIVCAVGLTSNIEGGNSLSSTCRVDNTLYPKKRYVDPFVLDYMYDEEEEAD